MRNCERSPRPRFVMKYEKKIKLRPLSAWSHSIISDIRLVRLKSHIEEVAAQTENKHFRSLPHSMESNGPSASCHVTTVFKHNWASSFYTIHRIESQYTSEAFRWPWVNANVCPNFKLKTCAFPSNDLK